jgi:hypothetical protein
MLQRVFQVLLAAALVALLAPPDRGIHAQQTGVPSQEVNVLEWIPNTGTHAWCRFGARAWKEVRVRTYAVGDAGEVLRSSTTVARTRVTRVGANSFSLCVSSTVEVAGREFAAEPQTFTRAVAPQVDSSEVVGQETVLIDGREYPVQIIEFVSTNGAQQEANKLLFCRDTTPQMLKRVTRTRDSANPDAVVETTVTVTQLNKMADILGELKCTWAATTVINMRDKTVTIREVNCADVPGELVSQITEEHDANGVLVARKELELVGYGIGRARRLFRRR